MKVAYNSCYGGFSLSVKGLTEFASKKGIKLTWYDLDRDNDKYVKVSGVPKDCSGANKENKS